jgi:uncharacterized protein
MRAGRPEENGRPQTYTCGTMAEHATRLRLRVSPGASRTELAGRLGDAWKVRVGAAPERGRANDVLLDFLADRLDVRRAQLSVVSGQTRRDKVIELRGLDAAEASRRLERQ